MLHSPDVYQECLNRIEKITPETRPQWGSMTAAQMYAHCAEIQEVMNGKELRNTPFIARLFKSMIRNMVVNEKPYPKNSRTHPQYRQTVDREFDAERKRLLLALDRFVHEDKKQAEERVHPLFGTMNSEEKGWSAYKHLDHHLTQFGV